MSRNMFRQFDNFSWEEIINFRLSTLMLHEA